MNPQKQNKGEQAEALFMQGCNCSQAVASAFAEEMHMDAVDVERFTICLL